MIFSFKYQVKRQNFSISHCNVFMYVETGFLTGVRDYCLISNESIQMNLDMINFYSTNLNWRSIKICRKSTLQYISGNKHPVKVFQQGDCCRPLEKIVSIQRGKKSNSLFSSSITIIKAKLQVDYIGDTSICTIVIA